MLNKQIQVFGRDSHPEVCETYGAIGVACINLVLRSDEDPGNHVLFLLEEQRKHVFDYGILHLVIACEKANEELDGPDNYLTRRHMTYILTWLNAQPKNSQDMQNRLVEFVSGGETGMSDRLLASLPEQNNEALRHLRSNLLVI